ncbi:hypothetical protein SAMN02982927_02769 [Sporolactobacillus nakayamae]|uniref:Uncharacterized protein n=1 Tax=Sporolactobacillus nakayamae TaxID=269670 RepID=A0A1I2UNY0_9BACL|nr:hypothetical protein SAMN02982927_02769 [Sporolactobacillus nakayamae]
MGHYCRICGRTRPNEKFSGKGHRKHICKECSRKKPMKNSRHENDAVSAELKSLIDTMPPHMQNVGDDNLALNDCDFNKHDADEPYDEDLPF